MALIRTDKKKKWISYIHRRIERNRNFLGFISGATGTGKSYSTLFICEQADPSFNIDQVVFDGLQLMRLINSGKLHKGSAIAFDEAGIGLSNRTWQSVTNRMLNFLIQTFRHQNFILILNSPYIDFIDAGTRKLFHAQFETIKIDYDKKIVKLKPFTIQYNSNNKKFYRKYLKYRGERGVARIKRFNAALPSSSLLEAYELKKKDFLQGLNKDIQSELEREAGVDKKDLTEIQQDTLYLLEQGLSVEAISKERKRSGVSIYSTIKLLKKKGYNITPEYEGVKLLRYNVKPPDTN